MKVKILVAILVLSTLLNAAGIVFFILFLNERGHYKTAKKDRARLQASLSLVQSGNMMNQALSSESVQKRSFVSLLDGQVDTYAFQAPRQVLSGSLDYVLLVYLHGMGSNHLEPFVTPGGQSLAETLSRSNTRLAILSPSYRKESSWGNDLAISDLVQNIRELMQEYPFKSIVLMGTSMGGCVSLNFAATAPEDIKNKIIGVACIEGAGDLKELFYRTKTDAVRQAMMIAFGGDPKSAARIFEHKSFLTNLDKLSSKCRIYVLSAKNDRVVPPDLQKSLFNSLNSRSIVSRLDEIDASHEAPPVDYYLRGLRFLMGEIN